MKCLKAMVLSKKGKQKRQKAVGENGKKGLSKEGKKVKARFEKKAKKCESYSSAKQAKSVES